MPATPSNPDQKDQKDKSPWRALLQGLWLLVKIPFIRTGRKIQIWDEVASIFISRVFSHFHGLILWDAKPIRNRFVSTCLITTPLILVIIFEFQDLLIIYQELFIFIFPDSAITTEPFTLSVWDSILILAFVFILGFIFFWLIPKFFGWLAKIISSAWFLFILVALSFLLFVFFVLIAFYPLETWAPHIAKIIPVDIADTFDKEFYIKITGSAFGLVFGFLLFAQRLDVMNKQTELTQRQIETTQNQHEAEQFKQACELLAHNKIVAHMGGIIMLDALARTKPETWHIKAVDALSDFIRDRSMNDDESPVKALLEWGKAKTSGEKDKKWQKFNELRDRKAPDDIAKAISAIARRLTDKQKIVVQQHLELETISFWPYLHNSWLNSISLNKSYLPKANMTASFFCHTYLTVSNLTHALFRYSHLDGALLSDTDLKSIIFNETNVSGADFRQATGFWKNESTGRYELDGCYCVEDTKPPALPEKIEPLKPTSIQEYQNIIADYWLNQ